MTSLSRSSSRLRRPRSTRGSVLIVALLLATILGISLVSYLRLSRNSLVLSNRSFFNTASLNLAETGLEEALWAFNQVTAGVAPATAWAGWDRSDGTTAKRTFTDFVLPANATAAVKVYVSRYDPPAGTQPKIATTATVTVANETRTVEKWLEVGLNRRSKFAMGLVAKTQITFRGNTASVDSWNSEKNDDGTPRGSPVDYSTGVKHSSGSAGSTSVAVGSVAVNNADIWGFVSVGSSSSSAVSVGSNGTIAPYGSPQGTVDTTRIATDFTTNLDVDPSPATGTWIVGSFPATIGTAGSTTVYRYAGDITSSFQVLGNVTLILTGTSGDVVRMTGGDTLTIATNSSLNLYATAGLKFNGNGITNLTNQAKNLQIWGTGGASQDIEVGGGPYFKGVIYAPNADVTLHGNPDVMGSIVANNIDVMGNAKFHYDESLADLGGNNPWGVVKWRELLNATDRSPYTTAMSGW
ncbi:MAG: hypothetical protein ABIY47_01040 [Opitutaceae bacterium]